METINTGGGDWDCSTTNETFINCFTQEPIHWDGVISMVGTTISCPRDSVDPLNFLRSTQLGLCNCEAAIQETQVQQGVAVSTITNTGGEIVEPFAAKLPSCDCFACPNGSRSGIAIWCDVPIVGDCYNFSCSGPCNDLINLCCGGDHHGEPETSPPSTEESSSSADDSSSGANVPLLLLCYHYVPTPLCIIIGILLFFVRWAFEAILEKE